MKIDIARQPLVPAFMTLFALAVAAMCAGIPVSDTSGAVRDALPLLAANSPGFRRHIRYGRSLPPGSCCSSPECVRDGSRSATTSIRWAPASRFPSMPSLACGIATGGNYLAGFAASMLLALATKNYCRAFCNGYGFDAIFRASLYLD